MIDRVQGKAVHAFGKAGDFSANIKRRELGRGQLGSQKAKRAELVPCAPEFAELLEATPEAERHGRGGGGVAARLFSRVTSLAWSGRICLK